MHAAHPKLRLRQQGIVAVMAVIFLITAVIFVLTQTLGMSGSSSIDNKQQGDSVAALFLAESGLQRAVGMLNSAGNTLDSSTCAGIASGYLCGTGSGTGSISPVPGGGSFCYGTPGSSPPGCATGKCDSCTVPVTGTVVNSASRSISATFKMSSVYGISKNGGLATPPACTTPQDSVSQLKVKNNYASLNIPGTAIFNLGIIQHTTGQPVNPVACANLTELFFMGSQGNGSGNGSIFGYSDFYHVLAGDATAENVPHGFSKSDDYSLVAVIFPNATDANTTPIGQFWDDKSNTTPTVQHNTSPTAPYIYSGATSSGVAGGATACDPPSATYNLGSRQPCTNWCAGADTLVLGVAAAATTRTDALTSVVFNTAGTNPQNMAMTPLAHFPIASATASPGDIYSDIWYLYNPDYMSASGGAGATSYPTAVKGTIGAGINLDSAIANNATSMVIASFSDPNMKMKLCQGDVLSGSNKFSANTTITTAGCSSAPVSPATLTVSFSSPTTGNITKNTALTASSTKLIVQGQTGANFSWSAAGTSTNTAGVYITSAPGSVSGFTYYSVTGVAGTTTPIFLTATTIVTQGASGNTISLPSGSPLPAAGTYVAVYSPGNGALPAKTKVVTPSGTQFTVDQAPTITHEITNATICGGICAFFADPSSPASTTQFQLHATSGTKDWTAGFTCLKGVQNDKIYVVPASTTSSYYAWSETVQ